MTLDQIEAKLRAELDDERWKTPANRTQKEYEARHALNALRELRYRLADYENAAE